MYNSGELRKKAVNLEKRHFPPQHGRAGWVGFIWLLRSALLPARQRSRTQRVVRTSRNGGRGRALDWVASIGPSLSRSFYPYTSRNLLSRKGPCRFWRRSQRTPAPECRILCLRGEAATTNAVLDTQERLAARDRTQGGGAAQHREETAPGHSFEQTKQSPEPLVPAAAVTGMSPSGRACGCQGHYKFPALHRAQPRPRADNKRFSSLPHRLGATPSPAPEPKPSAGRK